MKKIVIMCFAILLVTGCKPTQEEANKYALDTLENAYITAYITEGIGLPVFFGEKEEIDGETWYKITDNYKSVKDLKKVAQKAYKGDTLKKLEKLIDEKYKDIDGYVYTKSEGGCALPFSLNDSRKEIEKITTIEDVKSRKIIVEVDEEEYTLKKKGDNWISEEVIFSCE